MAYLEAKLPGCRYGLGTLSEAGTVGQCVVLSGDNEFKLNDDGTVESFGLLAADCAEDELAAVWFGGGIYETDQYSGTPAAGDDLACDNSTHKLVKAAGEGTVVIGKCISLVAGVLRFKLLV